MELNDKSNQKNIKKVFGENANKTEVNCTILKYELTNI